MRVVSIFLVFLLISLFDLPQLIKKRREKKKELYVYTSVLAAGFLLSALHVLEFNLWSPNRLVTETVHFLLPWL
ncbi:hypothetical protein [Ammoniphilus sp. 3BR4]|uniref:hypothetical protein n=1 Tax=Ammoniphilus sp. 3BR4 TaxID=3158265 RepID=UPI0034663CDF